VHPTRRLGERRKRAHAPEFELERKSGCVQPNVLDLRPRELIRHFDFFGVEYQNVFQFSSVDEPDVYALVAHS